MSSNDTVRRELPPDDTSASKRRRIAFSCRDCRRRKLRCDRLFPSCSRCLKGGCPESCTYDSEAVQSGLRQYSTERTHETFGVSSGRPKAQLPSVARSLAVDEGEEIARKPELPEDVISRLYAQEQRIRQLENRIIGLEEATHGTNRHQRALDPSLDFLTWSHRTFSGDRDVAMKESMIFRGKGFKTQFYGSTYYPSYLSQLPELRLFMKDMIVQHPQLAQVQRELKSMKVKVSSQDGGISSDGSTLATLLPQREVTDRLVHSYMENVETTYRLLHVPSFWAEYHALWNSPDEGSPAFVALLLLILATTNCLTESATSMFRGDSSVKRETSIMWIKHCDQWLHSQSRKHTTLATFQVHCLSFIAKQMNAVKRKQTWTSAGTLLRAVMSAGLHRDADIVNLEKNKVSSKKVSVFHQEMRRRIWATVCELELNAALGRGMPTVMRYIVEDCGPPLNLEDEEFDEPLEQIPDSKPLSQFTRSSYLHASRCSWALRVEVTCLINGSSYQIPYEKVLIYDQRLVQHLNAIPQWGQEGLISSILLQLQLQQLLLLLHRPHVRDEAWGSRHDYSAMVHLKSAVSILDLHDQLQSTGNSFLCLFRTDLSGAALGICYNFFSPNPKLETRLASPNSVDALDGDPLKYVAKALDMLEQKIMRTGVALQEYYCTCAIEGLLKKKLSLGTTDQAEHLASERVFHLWQRILELQDNYSAAATLASLPNMPAMPSSAQNGIVNGTDIAPPMPMDYNGLLADFSQGAEGLEFTNINGFDFDAFWDF